MCMVYVCVCVCMCVCLCEKLRSSKFDPRKCLPMVNVSKDVFSKANMEIS